MVTLLTFLTLTPEIINRARIDEVSSPSSLIVILEPIRLESRTDFNEFLFNKNEDLKPQALDTLNHTRKLEQRLDQLKKRFAMFNMMVQKELNRGHSIEAVDLYRKITLPILLEALRMTSNPLHHDFGTRYIYDELTPQIIERLENLYFTRDKSDLQEKYDQAT